LSLFAQVFVLGVLLVIPLLYTQVLPGVTLLSVLAAPAPPPAPAAPTRVLVKTQAKPSGGRVFSVPIFALRQPAATPVEPMTAAPIVALGEANGAGSGDGIVIGSVPSQAPIIHEKEPARPVRMGGAVSEANLIRRVQPLYPPLAKTTHVEGTVEFTATISKEGTIENLQLVRGHPLLVNAAREAILQWRYRPTLLNGEPVEVITDILVKFTLGQGGG
jgi:protein TonB